jgi:hypothetical protein
LFTGGYFKKAYLIVANRYFCIGTSIALFWASTNQSKDTTMSRLTLAIAGFTLAMAAGAASAAPVAIVSQAGDSCTYGPGSGMLGGTCTTNAG